MILSYRLPSPLPDIHELLSYLASRHTTSLSTLHSLKVFWDLDACVQIIISQLPSPISDTISRTNRAVWEGYRLYYIPGKQFSITRDHRDIDFFDLSQYFPGESEPSNIQEKADLLWEVITELGMFSATTLASPVAAALSSGLLDKVKDTIPTIWTAQDEHLDAFEYALKAGAREWVSNYQVGEWE